MDQNIETEITQSDFHFKRSRLNKIFSEAMKYPIIVVCAGAGYGKTTAVSDFVQEYQVSPLWVQLSERDNVGARFWENFTHSTMPINESFAQSMKKLGFPDTQEKLRQYLTILHNHIDKKRRVIVFDDCHYIENNDLVRFIEESIRNLPLGITLFLISRSTPHINIASLTSSDRIYNVSEEELRFTEEELSQYFRKQGISLQHDNLRSIMQDTEGWAFALNYIVRSYKKAPGYEGYLRSAMKLNIFRFMEIEIWQTISARLQDFLVRLSLIDHLSIDLIALLAGADLYLVSELEKQNAYVRIDSYINAFLIHPLFLEFLATKQDILAPEQKRETYTIAGVWCNKNGFKIDAITYYEKIGNYKAIVDMFLGSSSQIPFDISRFAEPILRNAPAEAFTTVNYLASTHLRTLMCQGLMQEAHEKAAYYEDIFLKLPEDIPFRRSSLCGIYYCWIIIQASMCLKIDRFDFDIYSEKLSKLFPRPIDPGNMIIKATGPYICALSSPKKEAVYSFISALKRNSDNLCKCFISFDNGDYELASGELKFYQGDIQGTETCITNTMNIMRKTNQTEMTHKILLYTLRIAVLQGNYPKTEQALKDMKANLENVKDFNRFIEYDLSLCMFYCALGFPEKTPDWLKEEFSPYAYAGFIENYANLMKARYRYTTRDYTPLLSYIREMKERESYLFGRIEMIAFEACIYYKLKNKEKSFAALEEAYETAKDNEVIIPFIELGRDMRTLTTFALKNSSCKIPKPWLEDINRRAASYAKRLSHIITEYKKAKGLTNAVVISPREREILIDLSHGLSRSEIAESRNLSINTVKMSINSIYMKLGTDNLAGAIRIAAEKKII